MQASPKPVAISLSFPGSGDVAGGENAGDIGLHHRIDLDGSAFDFQAPVLDGAERIVEADVDQQGVDSRVCSALLRLS